MNLLRRGTEFVGSQIATSLGGMVTLINLLQNTSEQGNIDWNNLTPTMETLMSRFANIGMNAGSVFLGELNRQMSLSPADGGGVAGFGGGPTNSLFGTNMMGMSSVFGPQTSTIANLFTPNGVRPSGVVSDAIVGSVPGVPDMFNGGGGGSSVGNGNLGAVGGSVPSSVSPATAAATGVQDVTTATVANPAAAAAGNLNGVTV